MALNGFKRRQLAAVARSEQQRVVQRVVLPARNEKQKLAMMSPTRFTAYGGARGGGKSWFVQHSAVRFCLEFKGLTVCIARRTLKAVKKNHFAALNHIARHVLPAGFMVWKASEQKFEFPHTGASIHFGFYDSDNDSVNWQGDAFDIIYLDEATQFKEEWFNVIRMCNRTSVTYADERIFHPRMFLTCNPGGIGHEWVKRLFITKDYHENERAEDYTFISASLYDNSFLMEHDPEYVNNLLSLPEKQRLAMLYGNWDVFDGQFFTEFSTDVHVVDPFKIPDAWNRYCAFDYGFDMFAALFVAVDYDGNAYVYKELFEGKDLGDGHDGLIISEAARRLTSEEDYIRCLATYAPPDMWNRRQETGKSAAEIYAEHRVFATKVSNNRAQGWMDLREWLKTDAVSGKPKLFICSNCTQLIESMQYCLHDEKNPDDMAKEPHRFTHGPDALRYFVSGRPIVPARPAEDNSYYDNDLFDDFDYFDGGGW